MITFREKTITLYHCTHKSNLPGIRKYGLLASKSRPAVGFESSLPGFKKPEKILYLSKSLEQLVLPPMDDVGAIVLKINVPVDIYNTWDKENKGDPLWVYWKTHSFKSWEDFVMTLLEPIKEKEIRDYGSLEESFLYQSFMRTEKAVSPEYCLIINSDIPASWISQDIITERDLKKILGSRFYKLYPELK